VSLLSINLLFQMMRVFGPWGRPGMGGRGVGADAQTGWWVGGADFFVNADNARDSDKMGALGFAMLVAGGVRFWRSSRILVMAKRLATKSAAPAVALTLITGTMLAASASRNLLLHVHTPACQPSWGQMFAKALDELMALDGTGQHLQSPQAPEASHRVIAKALWRRGRPAPGAARAAWAAHARS
jgi:hypothetical protein